MQHTKSRVEVRLERMLATTPPPTGSTSPTTTRLDVVYLTEEDLHRLNQSMG